MLFRWIGWITPCERRSNQLTKLRVANHWCGRPVPFLVWQQTTASQNGIYSVSSGSWTRTKDFDGNREVRKGTLVPVEGSAIMYRVTTSNPIVIGTSSIAFEAIGPTQTQGDIGLLLNPRTSAEIAALVTPSDYSVPSHDKLGAVLARRYGVDPTGATDSTAALQRAVNVAEAAGGYNSKLLQ